MHLSLLLVQEERSNYPNAVFIVFNKRMYSIVHIYLAAAMCYENESVANIATPSLKVLHYYEYVYITLSYKCDKNTISQYFNYYYR